MVKIVKQVKLFIDKVVLPAYSYKINFSPPEFLIGMIINTQAKIKNDKELVTNMD